MVIFEEKSHLWPQNCPMIVCHQSPKSEPKWKRARERSNHVDFLSHRVIGQSREVGTLEPIITLDISPLRVQERNSLTSYSFYHLSWKWINRAFSESWINWLLILKTTMSAAMLHETIWTDRPKYEQAEAHYQRFLAGTVSNPAHGGKKVGLIYSSMICIWKCTPWINKTRKSIDQSDKRCL